MQGCTLSHCRWGIFAGADGGRLRAGNIFFQNEEDITRDLYREYENILVQPWNDASA
jgi:hypothetical protein